MRPFASVDTTAHETARHYARDTMMLRFGGLALLVALVSLGLLGWHMQLARHRPIYYTGPQGPGLALPDVLGDDYVLDFATRWTEVRWSFQPGTLTGQHARIRPWLHPRQHKTFDVQTTQELALVKQGNMSSLTVVQTRRVVKREGRAVMVELTAQRDIWLGDRKNRPETLKVLIVLVPFPDGGTATTVVVWDQQFDPPLTLNGS